MKQLIQASEAAKLAENGTEKTREYVIETLDTEIRKQAAKSTKMEFVVYCKHGLSPQQGSIIRGILQDAGYTVMQITHKTSPDPRDCGLSWFDVIISSKISGSYMDR